MVTLDGIGEIKADKIIQYRHKQKFTSVDELTLVKGIGQVTLDGLRDQLMVAQVAD